MAFSKGYCNLTIQDILNKTSEFNILNYYLGITEIPCTICSPLRTDTHPSFRLYSKDGIKINYIDFGTGEKGGIFDLLCNMWNCSLSQALDKVSREVKVSTSCNIKSSTSNFNITTLTTTNSTSDLLCKVRDWKEWDIEYWSLYGISLDWLKYADVYPISHKIISKDGKLYSFVADKLAYAYIERKEGKVTMKIYQPLNKQGFKWSNKHDSSVISLWTKVPKTGKKICICSSLKDALCLWANCGIPALAVQGEAYSMSETAINELKKRFKQIYILLDNDQAGLIDGEKLAKQTGFKNLILPNINGAKDISDLYKSLDDKAQFKTIINNLFKN